MAVHRGPDLLLARGRRGSWPVHSTLAGFVEPGETLEHAVRREVREEVGVTVGDVTYFGSQAWPFPNSLMVGFFAEYAGGEIVIDPNEIAEARWFRPDEIPTFPSTFSIAVRLIRAHLARHT
jgi:NAD+ diphosphatase